MVSQGGAGIADITTTTAMSAKHRSRYRAGGSLVLVSLALFVMVVQSLVFMYQGNLMLKEEAQQEKLSGALLQLRLVWLDLQDAETGQRGYLLTGDDAYLVPYERGRQAIDEHMRQTYEAMASSGQSLDQLAALQPVTKKKIEEMAETIRLRRAGKFDAAVARLREGDGKRYMDQARQIINAQMDAVRSERTDINRTVVNRIRVVEYILVSIGFMVIVTVGVATRQMVRAIRRSDELAKRLEDESTHDGLTGLPNRRMLDHWLEKTLEQAARKKCKVAFLFIDLDGFKRVNDGLGHEIGDRVLGEASKRFAGAVRSADLLARFGGDEFAVVVPEVSSDAHLAALARRLIEVLRQPLLPEQPGYTVGASIGIAMYPDHGNQTGNLIRAADEAMYEAKRAGRGQFRFAAVPVASVA
jgi:diguanylate cyclase (GGDEF)-like protein